MTPLHFATRAELDAYLAAHLDELRGRALHMVILHDEACGPDACVCAPAYVLEELTAATYARGQREQARWAEDDAKRRGHA